MEYYATSLQHILGELKRIDLLIQLQVWRARQVQQTNNDYQAFCISEQEIDTLMSESAGLPRWTQTSVPLSKVDVQTAIEQMASIIAKRKTKSVQQNITLRLDKLASLFQLSPFDIDVLLICLAPEIDLRYERFCAYLQDDVTKKHPSVDMVLNLVSPSFEAKLAARERFMPHSPLFKYHLLHLFDDPSIQQSLLLSKYLIVDERVVNYLFDADELDTTLLPYAQHIIPKAHWKDLILPADVQRLLKLLSTDHTWHRDVILYFQGSYGVGKQTAAEVLCGELGIDLLVVDLVRLLNTKIPFATAMILAVREARLQNAALYLTSFDTLLADDKQDLRATLTQKLADSHVITFLAGNTTWEPVDAWHERPVIRIEFARPAYADRVQLWTALLNGYSDQVDMNALSNKFRFSGGQIRDAVATARNLARQRNLEHEQVTMTDLYIACRLQSNRKLNTLARKIIPHYTWNDIILPPDRMEQLREICNYVKYRARVYDEWGFDRKLAMGKGLNILFAGPSGTGKTMSAEIIARELKLDLYKIDLSTIVSKYIGETEKNLARIFAEAETSNAILFFDEADALFGKRSEVRDSHDRYANIEISYLLQKMEEYEGVVILATNLCKNMDDAFVRRMHFTIEFPFPTEPYRRRIWGKIWPVETPLGPELELDFMARCFEITGGSIRNIALAAAFLAAADDDQVRMTHLIRAMQREYQKMGKVVVEGEFGKYACYVKRDV